MDVFLNQAIVYQDLPHCWKKRQLCRYVWGYVNTAVMMLVKLPVCFAANCICDTGRQLDIQHLSFSATQSISVWQIHLICVLHRGSNEQQHDIRVVCK